MEKIEKVLLEHPFFKGLGERHLDMLASRAGDVSFKEGELLCCEGDDANQLYFIQRGMVALEVFASQRGSVVVQTIGDGDVLALPWLTSPSCWHFDARAIKHTRTIAINKEWLCKKCEENQDLGYELMKRFTQIINQRLHATMLQLLDVYDNPITTAV